MLVCPALQTTEYLCFAAFAECLQGVMVDQIIVATPPILCCCRPGQQATRMQKMAVGLLCRRAAVADAHRGFVPQAP